MQRTTLSTRSQLPSSIGKMLLNSICFGHTKPSSRGIPLYTETLLFTYFFILYIWGYNWATLFLGDINLVLQFGGWAQGLRHCSVTENIYCEWKPMPWFMTRNGEQPNLVETYKVMVIRGLFCQWLWRKVSLSMAHTQMMILRDRNKSGF
jgi:hypothetical protein